MKFEEESTDMAVKHYPAEFKADAVALYRSRPGATYAEIADELGVNRETLRNWIRTDDGRRSGVAGSARPGAEAQWQAALAIARTMPPLTPAQRAIIAAILAPTPKPRANPHPPRRTGRSTHAPARSPLSTTP